MVKPGGTGRPRLAISARLAPLPPKRLRISALPSALLSPKVNTHLPGFAASTAAAPLTSFASGLGALFFSALRAKGGLAGFARAVTEGFDFAAIFFDFATALAMAFRDP